MSGADDYITKSFNAKILLIKINNIQMCIRDRMYWAMLLNLLVYMPTLSLANTVSYNALEQYKCCLLYTS